MRTDIGYIFYFDLPKGAYATTFLSQVFDLYQGRPTPSWVNPLEIDTRLPLGLHSIQETEAHFNSHNLISNSVLGMPE